MKTAAVFFADGFEEIEGLSPVDYLRRAGVEVTTVGVKGNDYNDTMIVTSSHKIPIIVDTTLDKYLASLGDSLPDCVVCPGGSVGADNLASCSKLLNFLEKCYENGKITSAICASPAVLFGKTNILAGKKWTCYPGMEDNAKEEFIPAYFNEVVITDDNVVTSRGPGASEQFAMELVKILCGQETYDKIKKASQQR